MKARYLSLTFLLGMFLSCSSTMKAHKVEDKAMNKIQQSSIHNYNIPDFGQ